MFFFKNVLSQKRCYSGISVAYQGQSGMRSALLWRITPSLTWSWIVSANILLEIFFAFNRNKDLEKNLFATASEIQHWGCVGKSEEDIYLFKKENCL